MAIRPEIIDHIRTFVRDEVDANDQLEKRLDETGWDNHFLLVNAAFLIAIDRYFGGHRDDAAIIRFVAEMRARSEVKGNEIDPVSAEQMITAVFDPDVPLAATPEMIGLVQIHALYKALNDKPVSDKELDDLLAEAVQIVEQG